MVAGAVCSNCCPPLALTVRVKEFLSTEAIFPETDCVCGAACSVCAATLCVTGRAQNTGISTKLAKVETPIRIPFLIFCKPPQVWAGAGDCAIRQPFTIPESQTLYRFSNIQLAMTIRAGEKQRFEYWD